MRKWSVVLLVQQASRQVVFRRENTLPRIFLQSIDNLLLWSATLNVARGDELQPRVKGRVHSVVTRSGPVETRPRGRRRRKLRTTGQPCEVEDGPLWSTTWLTTDARIRWRPAGFAAAVVWSTSDVSPTTYCRVSHGELSFVVLRRRAASVKCYAMLVCSVLISVCINSRF